MDLITLTLAVKKALEELGVKKEPGKVLWKGKLTATDDEFSTASLDNPIGLEVGKTYTVTTDSGTYTSIAKEYGNAIVIGNTAMMGGDDSGESYCIVESMAGEAGAILDINGGTSATISAPETIHPIDPKFIPWESMPGGGTGGGAYRIDISAVVIENSEAFESAASGTGVYVTLTDEMYQDIEAAIGDPNFLGFMINLEGIIMHFYVLNNGNGSFYCISISFAGMAETSVWSFALSDQNRINFVNMTAMMAAE